MTVIHFQSGRTYELNTPSMSEEQYTDDLHFLFEMLQNADDCDFKAREPRVSIRYADRHLLFESNEVGFTKANVKAICSITLSSKVGHDSHGHQSIGEKGIGFKSVFKVAKSVWVKSGYYSFRFDRDSPLGRMRPIWDDNFPHQRTERWTSIFLQLDNGARSPKTFEEGRNFDTARVISGLQKLQPLTSFFSSR